jgi:arsenate reductase
LRALYIWVDRESKMTNSFTTLQLPTRGTQRTSVVSLQPRARPGLWGLWNRLAARRRHARIRRKIRTIRRRDPRRLRVLFVCAGNACRSQMAEAFANHYGQGVLTAESAGLRPGTQIPRWTRHVMDERGIPLFRHYVKPLCAVPLASFDLVVNLSRLPMPHLPAPVLRFPVPDPHGKSADFHRMARNMVEHLVETVLVELRGERDAWSLGAPQSAEIAISGSTK